MIVVVALVGSALTLLSMVKIWMGVFWGASTEDPLPEPKGWTLMGTAAAAGTVLTLVDRRGGRAAVGHE